MTLKIALLAVSLPLLALGGHGLYHAGRNRTQTATSCEEFERQRPRAAWLRMTGCELDYVGAGYRTVRGKIAELYFPVRAPQGDPAAPVPLVAVTTDPQALAIAQETIGDGRQPDQEGFLVMMLRIVTTLRASREVEGTIRTSPLLMLSSRRALEGMGAALAPDVAVLDLHARPAFLWPAIEAAAGLSAVLVFIYLLVARPPTEKAVAVAEQRLPAVMLLNLPADATTADIERAPPLGIRDEVMKQVKAALKGLKFKDGRGTLAQRRLDVTIDLGEGETVWTAVIHASGAGAGKAVRSLAEKTGWRAFVPKRGTFIDPDRIDEMS